MIDNLRWRHRIGFIVRISGACALMLMIAPPANAAGPQDPGADALQYVNHNIDWYRRVTAFEQSAISSEELLFRNAVQQNSSQVLRLAFAYGHGRAALLATEKAAAGGPASSRERNLNQATTTASQRVTQIQAELDHLNHELKNTPATAPAILTAKRDKLVAELNLAKARQGVLHDFMGFTSANGAADSLAQKIDDLERSTPEAQTDTASLPAKPGAGTAPVMQELGRPESAGIISLVAEMFALSSRATELKNLTAQTAALHKACDERRAPLRADLQEAIRRGDELSKTNDSDEPKTLDAQRQELDTLANRYKLLAAAAVPLGEQNILLESAEANLQQWHDGVQRAYHRVIRAIFVRLGAIGLSILVVLVISSIWRRATFRYVSDIRRRRQFLLIRRMLVGTIIVIILIIGVVTEFGSLMTFAGLITAGIAVALQTVILSGVAHFFFVGRYGVRVGDRVTISGITGDVIDVGIFRLYLMELIGDGRDLNPTGRIVVFANSVLFQPSAFFKQLPGADYNWHEMALTLAPDTNHELAEAKLMTAIESVVSGYRDVILKQHSALTKSVHYPLPAPEPHGRLRFVDAGLEFFVRYPVEIRRAAEIDDLITRKVLETIEKEPSLRLVATGTPKIQTAA